MKRQFLSMLLGGGVICLSILGAVGSAVAQTCISPPPDMTGWWPGDGNTDDIVGGRNAVLLDNAATGPGFVGDAFLLDGAGDFVEVSNNPALEVGSGDFTVDFWVLFNTTAGEQILVEKYVEDFSGNAPGWSFAKLSNNALVVAPNSPQTPPLSLQPNTWYHFAARRSSGNITIFVDGKKMASGPLGSGGNANTDSSLKFGHRGSPSDTPGSSDNRGFFLNGRIDEVELFVGRALSDAEILAIYDARGEGKCKIQVDYNGQTNCGALDSGFDKTTAALDSPWLSVAVGEMTKVAKAEITPRENATDVTFKSKDTDRATVKPDTATASPQVLEVTGVAQGETPGLIEARIQDRDPVVKALSVAVYEKKTLTVAVFVIKPKKDPDIPEEDARNLTQALSRQDFKRG
jgi:hypothetical protein